MQAYLDILEMNKIASMAANPSHVAEIARLFRTVRQRSMPYLPVLHTPEEEGEFFRDHVFTMDEVEIAIHDEKIVGFCAFREGWIDHLYVLPEFQGRGIGTMLLEKSMEKYPQLELWVFQKNEQARKFYERRGFVLAEITDGSGNEEKEPDARYSWSRK